MKNDLIIKLRVDAKTGKVSATKKEFDKLGKSVKTADKHTTDYAKRLTQIGFGALAIYGVSKAFDTLSDAARRFVGTAASFEKYETVLKTIEGSSDKAAHSMDWIKDFAKTAPFQIEGVTSSFIKLRAYGLDPTDGLLRTLGDTASAMGKGIDQAVEAVADAVVGENERLKEFGIKAKKENDTITYNWVNSSGEARTKTVENNQAIIQSTLEAIFNSKYAGAMEEQSKTWNGLVSNMEDNWTNFQASIMQEGGLFTYLKAIVTVVSEYMTGAFGDAKTRSVEFATTVMDGIKGVISGLGYTYDVLETFGDYFSVVGNLGKVAFYGLATVFSYAAEYLVKAFEYPFNFIIDGINTIFNTIKSVSFGQIDFGQINHVDWSSGLSKFREESHKALDGAKDELSASWDDLTDANGGQKFADSFIKNIDKAYEKLQNTPETVIAKNDYGDSPAAKELEKVITQDYKIKKKQIEKVKKQTEAINNNTKALSNQNYQGAGASYGTVGLSVSNGSFSKALQSGTIKALEKELNKTIYAIKHSGFDPSVHKLYQKGTRTGTLKRELDKLKAEERIQQLREEEIKNQEYITQQVKDFGKALDSLGTTMDNISTALSKNYVEDANNALFGSANPNLIFSDAVANAQSAWDTYQTDTLNEEYLSSYSNKMEELIGTLDDFNDSSSYASSAEQEFAKYLALRQVEGFQNVQEAAAEGNDRMIELLEAIQSATEDGVITANEHKAIDVLSKNALVGGNLGTKDSSAISWLSSVRNAVDAQDGILQTTASNTGGIGRYRVENTYGRNFHNGGNNGRYTDGVSSAKYIPYKDGGYTGSMGVDDVAGIVHGQEYVLTANTTKNLGLNNNDGGVFNEMLIHLKELNKSNKKILSVNRNSNDINGAILTKVAS